MKILCGESGTTVLITPTHGATAKFEEKKNSKENFVLEFAIEF